MKIYWLKQRQSDVPDGDDWLTGHERLRSEGMHVAKRRCDWRLGRWTAKLTLASFYGLIPEPGALADIEVRAAPSGAPEAFLEGRRCQLEISLSHSASNGFCAIALPGTNVGCDLEKLEARSPAFVADYFTENEQRLIETAAKDDRVVLTNLIWSAKESTLKALRVGLRETTGALEVEFATKPSIVDTRTEWWRAMRIRYKDGSLFYGRWCGTNCFIQTIVSMHPFQPVELHPEYLFNAAEAVESQQRIQENWRERKPGTPEFQHSPKPGTLMLPQSHTNQYQGEKLSLRGRTRSCLPLNS